ncbi:MAG: sporulation protein YtxC [Candidatus Pelethousia sp.]|nr:sporulation protein YtxC [Candidatus Pelethousia sp.]
MVRWCSVGTLEYDVDIGKLALRRLATEFTQNEGLESRLSGEKNCARFELRTEGDLERWCKAVRGLLLRDISHFELARMVNELPLVLEEKRRVLPEAVKLSRACLEPVETEGILKALLAFYAEENHLNLEGFLRFRMQETMRDWEICVMRAAEELLLEAEYWELMQVLSAFVQLRPPQVRDVYIILNPDGSCTLTDDQDSRIDYDRCTGDGVMSVLVGLSPERITVYDLSGGASTSLAETLVRVFEDRVRVFK